MKIFFPGDQRKKVVIIGGGFGGVELAKKLDPEKFRVILIDRHNYHTFQPLLYQVATGGLEPDSVAYPIRKIFHRRKNIYFRLADAVEILSDKNCVLTSIGEIDYDYLVIATGSTTNFYGNINLEHECLTLKSITDALNIRSWFLQNFEQALLVAGEDDRRNLMNIVIVGGGPTGVEIAGAVAELKRHVLPNDYPELDLSMMTITIVEASGKLLATMSEEASSKAKIFLEAMGVHLRFNQRVKDFDGKKITLDNGEELFSKSVIWTAGVMGKLVEGINREAIVSGNRLQVNEYNCIKGYETIFAIGDLAAMATGDHKPHPMVAPVAIQQGKNLAANLNKKLKDEWKPFRYKDNGAMATIGRNKAVADLKYWKSQGFFAWLTWLFVHLITLVGYRNKFLVLFNWIWSYFSYDNAIRLIIRPYKKKDVSE